MFSFVLILTTQPKKRVDQKKMLYILQITQIENIGVRRVCAICYHLAVFVKGVFVFSKGFPLHAEHRLTLSGATNNKQHLTQKAWSGRGSFVKFMSDPIELGLD